PRRVRALARLVVLDDPARAERVDVDAVDLAAQEETLPQLEAALQLGRGAVAAEADLEAPRQQAELGTRLLAREPLEVAPEALALGRAERRTLAERREHDRIAEARVAIECAPRALEAA